MCKSLILALLTFSIGTFKFYISGYDTERYDYISSNFEYAEMSVARP